MLTKIYDYASIERTSVNGRRYYSTPDGQRVASVTTILEATKSEEKKQALKNWRQRVGEKRAQEIVTEAAGRGTRMHRFLEQYIQEDVLKEPGGNPYSQQSHRMAKTLITEYIQPNVDAFYATEANLYYPELYAGTTDCVARWQGELSIIDFKQTNRPKKTEWIEDYFLQLTAYGCAHDALFGTSIQQGVILMCSQNFEPQMWVIQGDEFQHYAHEWAQRVEKYYQ